MITATAPSPSPSSQSPSPYSRDGKYDDDENNDDESSSPARSSSLYTRSSYTYDDFATLHSPQLSSLSIPEILLCPSSYAHSTTTTKTTTMTMTTYEKSTPSITPHPESANRSSRAARMTTTRITRTYPI